MSVLGIETTGAISLLPREVCSTEHEIFQIEVVLRRQSVGGIHACFLACAVRLGLYLEMILGKYLYEVFSSFIQFLIDAKIMSDEAPATLDDVTPLYMSSSDPEEKPKVFLKARMDPVPFVKVN